MAIYTTKFNFYGKARKAYETLSEDQIYELELRCKQEADAENDGYYRREDVRYGRAYYLNDRDTEFEQFTKYDQDGYFKGWLTRMREELERIADEKGIFSQRLERRSRMTYQDLAEEYAESWYQRPTAEDYKAFDAWYGSHNA